MKDRYNTHGTNSITQSRIRKEYKNDTFGINLIIKINILIYAIYSLLRGPFFQRDEVASYLVHSTQREQNSFFKSTARVGGNTEDAFRRSPP